jgi:hypothetical protein
LRVPLRRRRRPPVFVAEAGADDPIDFNISVIFATLGIEVVDDDDDILYICII